MLILYFTKVGFLKSLSLIIGIATFEREKERVDLVD